VRVLSATDRETGLVRAESEPWCGLTVPSSA